MFRDARGPAALRYALDLAPDWSTRQGRITGFVGERMVDTLVQRGPAGWTVDGQDFGLADIVDLDLGFTPATNMAQLRRAGLKIGDAAEFDVAWLEAGAAVLERLPQSYRRDSALDYAYDSPTVGYSATLTLAPSGFAAIYPGLWKIQP